ncbi:hypothetical protein L6164_028814 [Bauhinia variegata]|uniref:Uncharacterized protein n=1 Tax=Bauhinia variegata TaxID=167791 RepID=A0ACB9L6Z0_BAUVA|nr:hypothetical protein L6164_028814 [Bauhinia variegata]
MSKSSSLFALLIVLALAVLNQAQDQSGSTTGFGYRFNYDVYDRYWASDVVSNYVKPYSKILPDSLKSNDFLPPEIVMSTLATTLNASAPLEISWTPEDASIRYYVYMHFAELRMLANNEKRAFNVILNSQPLNVTIEPKNLSSSGLIGEIDPSISKLTMLEKLDLSNNSLNGEVPAFLSQLKFLKILNPDNNNFTGLLPLELIEKSQRGTLSISSPPCTNIKNNNNKSKNVIVPVAASVCDMTEERDPNETLMKMQKRQYSYSDVINITNNFDKILGKGGFGTVYLGFIDDIQVAVKMLSPESTQGHQQFQAEVKLLLTVRHRNLTSLIGYCNGDTHKGLIYEYMANGNLH